jgi:hypothetical protein
VQCAKVNCVDQQCHTPFHVSLANKLVFDVSRVAKVQELLNITGWLWVHSSLVLLVLSCHESVAQVHHM